MLAPLQYDTVRNSLPNENVAVLESQDLSKREAQNHSIIVLDDDPTGTQTVHGVTVITEWSVEAIAAEFRLKTPIFFILTNSRSLISKDASKLAEMVGKNIREAAKQCDRSFRILSRSDSTLRGHYPIEVDALEKALFGKRTIHVIIPAFFEDGRMTVDGIHYLREGNELIPVGESTFAKDVSFGFKSSRLTEWISEKTKGQKTDADILSISLSLIREKGITGVFQAISKLDGQSIIIVDAFSYSDLEVVTQAFKMAEAKGTTFIYRTAASFVRSYAGIPERGNWKPSPSKIPVKHGGLIVVGSHVLKTSQQLKNLLEKSGIASLELEVEESIHGRPFQMRAKQLANRVETILVRGTDLVIYTNRELVVKRSMEANLEYGNTISAMLVNLVAALQIKPSFLIAKGGITSSDIATKSLGVRRALVLGQLIAGVPVWQLGPESRFPGMPYFIFPGNVGTENSLLEAYQILKEGA
jgi:uncharacterized protein YgbK (DUF1537 family)